MNKKAWALALTVGVLGTGSAAQAALVPLTLGGVDVVCDDDYTPRDGNGPGLIWTADANLFKTQYDADNTVVNQIITAVPTITSGNGTHNVVAGDFNTANGLMTWYGAMAWAEWLGITNYGGASDWRLWSALNSDGTGPCGGINCTESELGHLFYVEGELSIGHAINDSTALTSVFSNMENSVYWSDTESSRVGSAWVLDGSTGFQTTSNKDNDEYYGWAVRPGQCPAAPASAQSVPAAGALGLGLLGLLLAGVARARLR
jgi:hypothetical protein